jgi:hypothetical protein
LEGFDEGVFVEGHLLGKLLGVVFLVLLDECLRWDAVIDGGWGCVFATEVRY